MSVYVLTGDDEHLLQCELEALLDELRAEHGDLDVEIVAGDDAAGLPEMRTASLFGGRRCVVVRDAGSLSGNLATEVDDYLEDPADGVVFVLVAEKRGRLRGRLATASDLGRRRKVSTPAPWDDQGWQDLVRTELARHDREIAAGAVRAILDHAGTDPSAIASKVAQVVAATDADAVIEAPAVEEVVEGHGNRGAFAVADAVAERDPGEAIVATRGALEAGEAPLAVLGAVTYRFRELLQVRAGNQPDRMSDGKFRYMGGIARGFRPGELAWCQDRLARADLDLKGSDLDDAMVLELAIIDLATSRDVGRPWNPLVG